MSINRYNPRRDANEYQIVDYLKRRGLSVERLNTPMDLLIGYKKHNYLVEVKMPGKKLNKNQVKFIDSWKGDFEILYSLDDAADFADKLTIGD